MITEVSLKGCLEFAVATEDAGAKFYSQLAGRFADNREVAELFELLSKDEVVHKQQFTELLNHVPEETGITITPEKSDFIKAMSTSEFFSSQRGSFKDVDKIENRDDALEKVFGFEKATLGFYRAVQEVLGENSILDDVIETEKSHITRIMKIMITGAKFRGLQDQWP